MCTKRYCIYCLGACISPWILYLDVFLSEHNQICLLLFSFVFLIFKKTLFFWLRWVFIAARGLSLVAASWGYSLLWCACFSLQWLLLLRSTGSRRAGSVVVAHGLSCSSACGIFLDQGSNPCPLHWQTDSQPLCHQRSPCLLLFNPCGFLLSGCLTFYLTRSLLTNV